MLVVGRSQVLVSLSTTNTPRVVLVFSQFCLGERVGDLTGVLACSGGSDWLMSLCEGVLMRRQESHLFSYSFSIRRHQLRAHRKLLSH